MLPRHVRNRKYNDTSRKIPALLHAVCQVAGWLLLPMLVMPFAAIVAYR